MAKPRILLMDEPSMGLAPVLVDGVFELIEQLHNEGTTILLVEQDVNRGLQEADRVYCMLEGKVSLSGKPSELSREAISKAYFGI